MADSKAKETLSSSSSSIDVVMVPFPLQSHLNQLLQLSHIIASDGIKVHFVASSLHVSQVKSRATSRNPNPNITFHGFPTPDFPSHPVRSFEAYALLGKPLKSLIESLSALTRRVVVIHDPFTSTTVQESRFLPKTEFYVYNCISAVACFAFARDAAGLKTKEDIIPPTEGCVDPDFLGFAGRQFECLKTIKISGYLRNTARVIESGFLDFLVKKESVKHWAIGPLETTISHTADHGKRVGQCFDWLNKQEPKSVLYVCFGTTTFMTDGQIGELAIGLEKSGVKFIWVLRDADKVNIFDQVEIRRPPLLLGFEERVETSGTGMVLREWVPQMEILGHPSTGGFMSHCGWNSCLESLSLGVPVLTWPMHSDQPMNAALITHVLKVGFVARDWAKRGAMACSWTISEAVERLMKSKEGNEVRKRTENIGNELRKSVQKGGVSRMEFESFVAHITRI